MAQFDDIVEEFKTKAPKVVKNNKGAVDVGGKITSIWSYEDLVIVK